jgi:hypothetical protein
MQAVKQAKVAYRTAFDEVKTQRSTLELLITRQADLRQDLINSFEKWLETPSGARALANPSQVGSL